MVQESSIHLGQFLGTVHTVDGVLGGEGSGILNSLVMVEGVDQVLDDDWVLEVDGCLGINHFNQCNVLDGSSNHFLDQVSSNLHLFFLTNSQDGEVFAINSTGQIAGDEGTMSERTGTILSSMNIFGGRG